MKYIKTYESIKNDMIDYLRRVGQLDREGSKYRNLINDYIYLNEERWDDWDIVDYADCTDFDISGGILTFDYMTNRSDETYYGELENKDSEDFFRFVENPELYKSTKKYNL